MSALSLYADKVTQEVRDIALRRMAIGPKFGSLIKDGEKTTVEEREAILIKLLVIQAVNKDAEFSTAEQAILSGISQDTAERRQASKKAMRK